MPTFHHYLHIVDQITNDVESLRSSVLRPLEGKSIEPLENRFDLFFT